MVLFVFLVSPTLSSSSHVKRMILTYLEPLQDPKEPANILEAYTFNFYYSSSTGLPSISVTDSLGRLDIQISETASTQTTQATQSTQATQTILGSAAQAPPKHANTSALGMPHSIKDVKLAIRFRPGEDTTLMFGTHSVDEVPMRIEPGRLQTGHHGVSIRIETVSTFTLRPSTVKNTSPPPLCVGLQDANFPGTTLSEEVKAQLNDRDMREVLWVYHRYKHPLETKPVKHITDEIDSKPIDSPRPRPVAQRNRDGEVFFCRRSGADEEGYDHFERNQNVPTTDRTELSVGHKEKIHQDTDQVNLTNANQTQSGPQSHLQRRTPSHSHTMITDHSQDSSLVHVDSVK
ncbi:hypothetical protein P7C73_g6494, partial [Tremellales sp. Uapishka_1]